jgi:hypothetical protein
MILLWLATGLLATASGTPTPAEQVPTYVGGGLKLGLIAPKRSTLEKVVELPSEVAETQEIVAVPDIFAMVASHRERLAKQANPIAKAIEKAVTPDPAIQQEMLRLWAKEQQRKYILALIEQQEREDQEAAEAAFAWMMQEL